MAVLYTFLVVMAVGLVSSKPTTDIVTEILRVIDGKEDLGAVADYLNRSRAEIVKELPLVDSDGKQLSYTFFAPKWIAFIRQIPADAPNPLILDDNFRHTVLLRHFARQQVSSNDLTKLDKLIMADSKEATLTRSDGTLMINDAEIGEDSFSLANNLGTVYIVERVFMSGDEVSEVLSKNPRPGLGLFQLPPDHPSVIAQSATKDEPAGIRETPLGEPLPLLGGFNKAELNEADVKEMAEFATTTISKSINASPPLSLVNIVKAEKQVVAGINYKLQLELKDEKENAAIVCDVVVFDQSFTSTRQVSSSHCSPTLTLKVVKN